jgi:hypothetical protein
LKEIVVTPGVPIQKEIIKKSYELLQHLDHVMVILYYA